MKTLYDFAVLDTSARWRTMAECAVVGGLAGFLTESTIVTAVIVALIFVTKAWMYVKEKP